VQLEVSVAGGQAIVSVSDTGMGIPPDEQGSVFDEFYRSRRVADSGFTGLGLGLAISRQLIQQHGGELEVRSPGDLGAGSTFSFRLPLIWESDPSARLTAPAAGRTRRVAILAEDDVSAGELREHLRLRGYEAGVYRVDTDTEWLAQLARAAPCAVILENSLANREGRALIGLLKQQKLTEGVPVLAFSVDAAAGGGRSLQLSYLNKPLQFEQLIVELERLEAPADTQQTVLVVDDDPGILDLHRRLIERTGRRVLTAPGGRAALEQVAQSAPDLILLDLLMPDMDGFAVLEQLQSGEATRGIPVIVLTGHLLSDLDLEQRSRAVAGILGKGLFSAEEIVAHVEAALSSKPALNPATRLLIRRAMAYIHNRYAEPLTREAIADHIGISADYLTDCFRQELGVTPMTYVRRFRVRQAGELLRNSDQSITRIALAVGFSDGAHFTRTFQREMKMTPRAFRRNRNGKSG
jgi:AraC-like DNA-binding protein/response regulator of citrate/malate metabolism